MRYSMHQAREDCPLLSLHLGEECLFHVDTDGGEAWQELKDLLESRINDGLAGKVSSKTISEILDEELAGDRP